MLNEENSHDLEFGIKRIIRLGKNDSANVNEKEAQKEIQKLIDLEKNNNASIVKIDSCELTIFVLLCNKNLYITYNLI